MAKQSEKNEKAVELKIEYIPLTQLKPYKNNARRHEEADLKTIENSIAKFGMCDPIGIWSDKNIIVEGHGRYLALKKLGKTEAPCIRLDHLNELERREYALAHNKTAEMSVWDDEMLEAELKAIKQEVDEMDTDFDMSDFGFDMSEFDLNEDSDEENEVEEDEAPEVDEESEPITKLGDVWKLGKHRLMCGDSTDRATVEKLMDGKLADLVFTDPPYGIGIDGQKQTECKNPQHNRKAHEFMGWDSERPPKEIFEYILSLKIPTVIFGGNYFADMLPASRGWIYWDKGQDGLTMSDGELAYTNLDKPLRRVIANRGQLHDSVHPTQKPISVVKFCIDYLGEGEIVLDLFGGSGSTLIACEQLGRTCYMMERLPKYCDVIIKRWENLTGKKAKLVKGK